MYSFKSLVVFVLSAQLVLTALAVNVEKPVISDVDKAYNDITADKNHILASVPVAASIIIQDKVPQTTRAGDCSASNVGLGRLLREAKSLLPLRQIQQLIVDSAANDQQVKNLIALQRSEATRKSIANIKQSSEYLKLREYTCQQLQLDVTEMWSFVKSFISLTKEQVKPSAGEFKGRAGIIGLLQEIYSILPRQQMKDLYQQLLKQDPQLNTAVQRIKSSKFRRLLRNVRLLPDALVYREQLLNAGVPLMELKELVNAALGWTNDEFGDNGKDLNI